MPAKTATMTKSGMLSLTPGCCTWDSAARNLTDLTYFAFLLRRAPGQQDVVPKGMTAGGLARRRASLAPQPILPEVDHKINQKVLTVSGELDASTTLDDTGGAFMAAVEEDV